MDSVFLRHACDQLAARDPALDSILRQCGYPPLWDREPGFSTLVHIILEQQVSLALRGDAQKIYDLESHDF